MNILLYNEVPNFQNHFAETIELALKRYKKGDTIYLVTCNGELPTCAANPYKKKKLCTRCIRIKNHVVRNILKEKIIELPLCELGNNNVKSNDQHFDNPIEHFIEKKIAAQLIDLKKDTFASDKRISSSLHSAGLIYYRFIKDVLSTHKITRAYVWNGRRVFEALTVKACEEAGISFKTHISGWKDNSKIYFASASEIHSIKDFSRKAKRIIRNAKISLTSEEFNRLGSQFYNNASSASKVYEIQTAEHQKNKPLLAIFTSTPWETAGLSEYRSTIFKDQFEGLKWLHEQSWLTDRYDVVIRWHPNQAKCGQQESEFTNNLILNTPNFKHYLPRDQADSYQLLIEADRIVTFGSTIGAEACFLSKPVISLAGAQYDYFDLVYKPTNISDLELNLKIKKLNSKQKSNAVEFGYAKMKMIGVNFKNLENNSGNDADFSYLGKRIIPRHIYIKDLLVRGYWKLRSGIKNAL